jgi:hypothetical protein
MGVKKFKGFEKSKCFLKNSEHQHAVAFCKYVKFTLPYIWEVMFHVPNGGHRHIKTAFDLKQEGVKAGVPDYFVPYPTKSKHGLFIELKTETGRLSKVQQDYLDRLEKLGYECVTAYGWQQAVEFLENYLNLKA